MTANSGWFCCCGFCVGGPRKIGFSAFRNMPSRSNERPLLRIRLFASKADFRLLSSRATICDPCRGLGSSNPARFITALTCSQDAAKTPQDAPRTPPGRPKPPPVRPKSTQDAPRRPAGAPPRRPNRRFPPSGRPLPLFGSNFHSIVIAAVVPAPCICNVLTMLGGRAGYGKSRKLLT